VSARPLPSAPRHGFPLAELVWLALVGCAVVGMLLLSLRLQQVLPPQQDHAGTPVPAEPVRLAQGQVLASAERRAPVWRVAAQE
jgi:hypothetical protein